MTDEGEGVGPRGPHQGREVDARWIGPHLLSLLVDGRVYEIVCTRAGEAIRVQIGEEVYHFARSHDLPARATPAAGVEGEIGAKRAGTGPWSLRAPMPARVIRVPVTVGQVVEAGQGLVVLEAMKMENEIAAPHRGTVRELRVAAGDSVAGGQVLVVIE
ncbi:MAG: biotin/lipoyl-containing protein [Candidatus Methylomirabilales bacterium]